MTYPVQKIKSPAEIADGDSTVKTFHDLMAVRVKEILLVSSPYDAFIMEEDGRLAERLVHEYKGLNLTRPPRLTWVSTVQAAFEALARRRFDCVITMPSLHEMEPHVFGRQIKRQFDNIPVFLLAHRTRQLPLGTDEIRSAGIDKVFVWSGNTDLLVSMIKSLEDRMNVADDTRTAKVRVIIFVEDSPYYCSSLLPLLYRVIVTQTQTVMEESLNETQRMLRMRARPKILTAENYEEAVNLYQTFKPYVLAVLSDVRFNRSGKPDSQAGFSLLEMIRKERPDLPLLVFSSEEVNRSRAVSVPAVFLNKNSASLHKEIRSFFIEHLGFGDFIFRTPEGREVARADNLWAMEKILPKLPWSSLEYHARRNHFSAWLMARSEIELAAQVRPVKVTDFDSPEGVREYLIACLRSHRRGRQKGVVADFLPGAFDPETDFFRVGRGSLGGKARGLAFMATRLKERRNLLERFPDVDICVPQTLVISTEGFEAFVEENGLKDYSVCDCRDAEVTRDFLAARFPEWLRRDLELYLKHVTYPLAVRSSSLLEDAQFQPTAGIYSTYMIPNNHRQPSVRLQQLLTAIQLVYASTYLETPKFYAQKTWLRTEEEKMAVIVQQVIGQPWGDYFYPTVSGLAQSRNFYPVERMKPEEGIVHIAMGLGKQVVEGGRALRFCPRHPQSLPQFASVDDALENAQRFFFAISMAQQDGESDLPGGNFLVKLAIDDAREYPALKYLASSYVEADHRIRDPFVPGGRPVLTFAGLLKYKTLPLPEILSSLLELGEKDMGGAVEIEFALNLPLTQGSRPVFALLQIRPMAFVSSQMKNPITPGDRQRAFCFSSQALGPGGTRDVSDIVFVKPDLFDPAQTRKMAAEIRSVNHRLAEAGRKYVLIGPGRWGSRDPWLGIPVTWRDISCVCAIVETTDPQLAVEPSQGTHFFHNLIGMGVSYLTISRDRPDRLDWDWLTALPAADDRAYIRHVRLDAPAQIKTDGKTLQAALLKG